MTVATVDAAVSVRPTWARLIEDADQMLDRYLESQREVDGWMLLGFDRGLRFELDRVIDYVTD